MQKLAPSPSVGSPGKGRGLFCAAVGRQRALTGGGAGKQTSGKVVIRFWRLFRSGCLRTASQASAFWLTILTEIG